MKRHFFDTALLTNAQSLVPETLVIKGGTVEGSKGLRIDGKLTNCEIVSTDDSPVHVSALAVLKNCKILGQDILFEGQFSGDITAKGKIEFASGCIVMGNCYKGGDVYFDTLSDVDDLTIRKLKTEVASDPKPVVRPATGANGQATGTNG